MERLHPKPNVQGGLTDHTEVGKVSKVELNALQCCLENISNKLFDFRSHGRSAFFIYCFPSNISQPPLFQLVFTQLVFLKRLSCGSSSVTSRQRSHLQRIRGLWRWGVVCVSFEGGWLFQRPTVSFVFFADCTWLTHWHIGWYIFCWFVYMIFIFIFSQNTACCYISDGLGN